MNSNSPIGQPDHFQSPIYKLNFASNSSSRTPMLTQIHELDRTDVEFYPMSGGIAFDRFFSCPLDYKNPEKKHIQVFVRHLVPSGKVNLHTAPFALYLQGGPGFQSPYQTNLSSGWVGVLLNQGYQILLLDQRGTGLSTAINAQSQVSKLPTLESQVEYMTFFRADSIVKDCEHIRKIVTKGRGSEVSSKFTLLGQSFGGFCITTYLSFHPEGIDKAILTGGLPPIHSDPIDVYRKLIPRVIKRNQQYYSTYKKDVERIKKIASFLEANDVTLPNGGKMTVRRFQQLGLVFGSSGGFAAIHKVVLNCCNDLDTIGRLSYKSLLELENFHDFETNVLYAVLHEAIYCNGPSVVSGWACHQAISSNPQFNDLFNPKNPERLDINNPSKPFYFTGEMIFPWMSEDYVQLNKFAQISESIAQYDQWSPLYDTNQLNNNKVPVVAVSYYEDPYVDLDFSIDCANNIAGCELWITNEYLHNGLSVDSRVINRLLGMFRADQLK
ncbi:hypothetical protein BB559_007161 [Furculomyces boomerangus]|uniref:AB hydrolase-1 domain-containing protein n=1 Tax=Furculomyces boomerangus TaxID=61424 RepID=A0A2T9XYN0_9FUNG|nr:hypothetical protein BB559_007161 [Furculomyces boomerangus]